MNHQKRSAITRFLDVLLLGLAFTRRHQRADLLGHAAMLPKIVVAAQIVGGTFCVLALGGLAVPARGTIGGAVIEPRLAVGGVGCALILWLAIVPIVLSTRRNLMDAHGSKLG